MTITNTLLFLILLTLLTQLYTAHQRGKRITAYLDSLADMLGDLLRELITATKDKTK